MCLSYDRIPARAAAPARRSPALDPSRPRLQNDGVLAAGIAEACRHLGNRSKDKILVRLRDFTTHGNGRRPARTLAMSAKVALIRCGASNMTIGRGSEASRSSHRRLALERGGGKPANVKSPPKPDMTSAASTALAPGTACTVTPAASASRTSRAPGSDSSGVPASETRATDSPAARRASRRAPCARCDMEARTWYRMCSGVNSLRCAGASGR